MMDWNDDGWFGLPSNDEPRVCWVNDLEVARLVALLAGSIHSRSAKRKHRRRRIKARRAT